MLFLVFYYFYDNIFNCIPYINTESRNSGIGYLCYWLCFCNGWGDEYVQYMEKFQFRIKTILYPFNRSISHHASTKYNRLDFNLSSHVRNCQLYHGFQHQQLSTVLIKIVQYHKKQSIRLYHSLQTFNNFLLDTFLYEISTTVTGIYRKISFSRIVNI